MILLLVILEEEVVDEHGQEGVCGGGMSIHLLATCARARPLCEEEQFGEDVGEVREVVGLPEPQHTLQGYLGGHVTRLRPHRPHTCFC